MITLSCGEFSANPNALGCFGYADYETNQNQFQPLGIDNGKGPVLPSLKTVEKAEYQPLSRPLLIYINAKSAQTKPQVKAFVDFYLKNASTIVQSVGYVAFTG
jgi:phosphate transport system substrate-binding protein